MVTTGLFNDAWWYLFSQDAPAKPQGLAKALETATNTSAVLLAHSYGGAVAYDVLFGELLLAHAHCVHTAWSQALGLLFANMSMVAARDAV